MDLEGAAALSVCARCEKQRREGQHECTCPVASGRGAWQCGAVSRSAWRQQASARKERKRERARRVYTLDRRARVEHHSASRGGIACHAGRGEGSASGGSFLCVCAAAAASAVGKARLGRSFVSRCVASFSHSKFESDSPNASYKILVCVFKS